MKIMCVGDVHCNFGSLRTAIDIYKPDKVFQVGDFGVWPGSPNWDNFTGCDVPVYFCDGNHENHDVLPDTITEIKKNVFYVPRFQMVDNVLFIGGANSIDKMYRTPGFDWFPTELIKNIPETIPKADIVISHTCPESWFKLIGIFLSDHDPSRIALDIVLNEIKPKKWVFGHFHKRYSGFWENTNTEYHLLDTLHEPRDANKCQRDGIYMMDI